MSKNVMEKAMVLVINYLKVSPSNEKTLNHITRAISVLFL